MGVGVFEVGVLNGVCGLCVLGCSAGKCVRAACTWLWWAGRLAGFSQCCISVKSAPSGDSAHPPPCWLTTLLAHHPAGSPLCWLTTLMLMPHYPTCSYCCLNFLYAGNDPACCHCCCPLLLLLPPCV